MQANWKETRRCLPAAYVNEEKCITRRKGPTVASRIFHDADAFEVKRASGNLICNELLLKFWHYQKLIYERTKVFVLCFRE